MKGNWKTNNFRLLFIIFVQIFPIVGNSVPVMNNDVDYDNDPIIVYPDYQNEETNHYNSAFEEANATFSDFESQTSFLYELICHQSCTGERTTLPNRYCDECYCDRSCHYYGDCCPDAQGNDDSVLPSRCLPISVPGTGTRIKMIQDCPNEDDHLQDACFGNNNSHINLTQPVSDVVTGLVYRNLFCARCHGIQNFLPWDIGMRCSKELPTFQNPSSSSSVYLDIINKEGCGIQYSPVGNLTGHYCFREGEITSSCNTTGDWVSFDPFIEKACLTLPRASILNYKNIFCFICNTFRSWKQIKSMYTGYDPIPFSVSLSSLLDLSDEMLASDVDEDDLMTCPSFTIYDPLQCICRNVSCVNGKKYENGECKSVFAQSYAILYSVPLILDMSFNFSLIRSIDTNELKDIVANEISQLGGHLAWVIISVLYASPCAENISLKYSVRVEVYFNKPMDTDKFERNLISNVPIWGSFSQYKLKGASLKFKLSGRESNMGKYILNSDLTVPCKHFNTRLAIYGLYPDKHNSLIWSSRRIDFDKVHTCPSVLLDASEALLSNSNNSLYIQSNNRTMNPYEFRIEDNGYRVCIEDYIVVQDTSINILCEKSMKLGIQNKEVSVLGITSGVCTSLSLLFLLITFLVFCCLKKLRTSIGLPLMALTITLFIAQALFEFGAEQVEIPWVCQTLGILTHLFWLSTIFWMNVCTIILFYKLCYPMQSRVTSTYKMMFYSILYALLFPIIIVSLVVVTSRLITGNIGYGGKTCYITTATARRFGFALPVGVLISVNIALFSYTFIKLKKHKNLQSNRENEISMWACLKLSTITGLTWCFAFIYEATRHDLFSYLFTVFVGAQGCILFFVFVCNKRVKDEISRLLSRSKTPKYIHNHSRNGETSSTSDQKVTVAQ